MVEVAHVAVRMDCRFKDMFWRIASKGCRKVAYVAVARKLLTVIWHLLAMGELYVEEGFSKRSSEKSVDSRGGGSGGLSLDVMVGVLGRVMKLVFDVDGG
jgi:hypothetical protein